MKKILHCFVLLLPVFAIAQQDSTRQITLDEGTVITLLLKQNLSSSKANVGDLVIFETAEPVIVGDKVLLRKGLEAYGKVTEAQERRSLGKSGKLSFSIDYLKLDDGRILKLTAQQKSKGKDKTGTSVTEAAVLSPLFLLKKGKDVKYKIGDKFTAYLGEDYKF